MFQASAKGRVEALLDREVIFIVPMFSLNDSLVQHLIILVEQNLLLYKSFNFLFVSNTGASLEIT